MKEQVRNLFAILGIFAILLIVVGGLVFFFHAPEKTEAPPEEGDQLSYSFSTPGILEETGSLRESSSPYWWVNSGGALVLTDGIGTTFEDELPASHHWRKEYARTNPGDTEDGAHPQNVFRLISKFSWENVRFEGRFRIGADNLSESPNRNETNGIFLMSRYEDEDDFYYAGMRVDGDAVIKKKYDGTYYTLAQVHVFPGSYDRTENPNLLPKDTWIDMRSETVTEGDTVTIRLYLRDERANAWREVLKATDDGSETPPLLEASHVGVRTDFMDVAFDAFLIEEI